MNPKLSETELRQMQGMDPATWIPKHQLKDGITYDGVCRNHILATWDAAKNEFWSYDKYYGTRETLPCREDAADHEDCFFPLATHG